MNINIHINIEKVGGPGAAPPETGSLWDPPQKRVTCPPKHQPLPKSNQNMDPYHAQTMAYAACTSTAEFIELDREHKRCNNKVRLAKMEQLAMEDKLKHAQAELDQANDKLAEIVKEHTETYQT